MSDNPGSQAKLTLDDLDHFLSAPPQEKELPDYYRSAAVLAAFDPFELKKDTGGPQPTEEILTQLLPVCEPLTQGVESGLWTLSLPYRRQALRELGNRANMKKALAANKKRLDTPLQRMFERLLEPVPLNMDKLSRAEIAATLEVIGWVEDILDNLPDKAQLRHSLTRADLLAPMQRLTSRGFVGREQELGQIEQYVVGPKPQMPLFVFGSGGVGKSTLLAQFVLARAVPRHMLISYVDLDRPVILPERPLSILLESITQLRTQLDMPAGATESMVQEITSALARHETGRQLESGHSDYGWILQLFSSEFKQWLQGRHLLFIVDTLEEAQFMGSDVMWPLIQFLISMDQSLPELRVILSGRTLPQEYAQQAFGHMLSMKPDDNVEDPKLLEKIPFPLRPLNVSVLETAPALKLLRSELSQTAPKVPVSDAELKEVIGLVSGNPMCLKLAGRLLREEGVDKLRTERSELFAKLKAEKIQALLYGRILRHVHDDDVRKVAYPGLIVRRIDPAVIRDVLAKPCKLVLTPERDEYAIFSDLQKEAALVYTDPDDGSLRHRADVRRAMLEDLTDHVSDAVVEEINRSAVAFYRKLPGPIARAEEIYHLLRLGESEVKLSARWIPDAASHLQGALDELPAQLRLWLADRLNVTLDASVRDAASQERWESQAARSANRYLESRLPDKALVVLHERKKRLPRSQLYLLEAEAYRFQKKYKKALEVARAGVDAVSKAGAIDMALELLLKMVVIEEAQGDLSAAETLLGEATAISKQSSNDLLRLRVQITGLRLQRQLRPKEREERESLRAEVMQILDDEMIHKLLEHPVLLREVAAELAKQDPRVASAAFETLGIEVSTDAQAKAFGNAVSYLNQPSQYNVKLKGIKDVEDVNDPKAIRNWATKVLTRSDAKKLTNTLASAEAGSEILGGFRDYFRAGVTSALQGRSDINVVARNR